MAPDSAKMVCATELAPWSASAEASHAAILSQRAREQRWSCRGSRVGAPLSWAEVSRQMVNWEAIVMIIPRVYKPTKSPGRFNGQNHWSCQWPTQSPSRRRSQWSWFGLHLSSQTPFHADADDSDLFLKTLAVRRRYMTSTACSEPQVTTTHLHSPHATNPWHVTGPGGMRVALTIIWLYDYIII